VHDFETLLLELESFSDELAKKPMFVAASKMDVAQDASKVAALRVMAEDRHLPFFEISSATGQGIEALKFALAEKING
jgi:GTP-binding protein